MRKILVALLMVALMSSFAFAASMDSMLVNALKDNEGMIPVIVQMVPGAKHVDVTAMGGKMGYTYHVINGFSAQLPAAAINALAKNPNVFAISYDKEVTVNLNEAIPTVNSDYLWAEGYTGQGVTIAFIDTGIYPHQNFQNRIIGWKDYVNGQSSPYDDNGHGTHCAGIAAGNGTNYDGAARDAYLVGVKVLNRVGSANLSTIIAGIEWCVTNKNTYSIDIISISFGGTVTESSERDPLCFAVRTAWSNGIVVCAAAGNNGPGYYTIVTPGNEPMIITIGASDDKGDPYWINDEIAYFSSRGPTPIDGWTKPDIAAPGVNITSCDNRSTGYVTMSGTSMSTSLVAGICAQYLEAYPTASPNTIKSAIVGSGRDLGYDVYTQGAGLVDAYGAVH